MVFSQNSESGKSISPRAGALNPQNEIPDHPPSSSFEEVRSRHPALRQMYGFGHSRLHVRFGEEEGCWKHPTHGSSMYPLPVSRHWWSVGGCAWNLCRSLSLTLLGSGEGKQ